MGRNTLSAELSTLVGRERELAEIRRLLAANRLLTLTGGGGIGKTRLAVRIAADLERERENAYQVAFVGLADLADPELVAQAVASELRVTEQSSRSTEDRIVDVLQAHRFVLVLDNCEHLIDASAKLAELLLRECPQLCVLPV